MRISTLPRMNTFDRIADSITALASGDSASLDTLARRAGLSPTHFQRTFQKLAGVSPLKFQQVLSLESAREALLNSRSVLDAAFDGGLSGPGRLHDAMVRIEKMTPGELKTGLDLTWDEAETDLGTVTIAATPRGICGVSFDGLEGLEERWPTASFTRGKLPTELAQLQRALMGEALTKPLALLLRGTDLQLAVWRALLQVPPGTVTTYSTLAKHVGAPGASRAIGNAVGANHLAVLIPCHRVIQSTGALGGYRWGQARKAALLARELTR